ncbi:hypothetical protein LINPERHAP1_LOCUS5904, partial [Linum perenne]
KIKVSTTPSLTSLRSSFSSFVASSSSFLLQIKISVVSFLQLKSEPIFWWKSNLNPVLGDNSMQI